MNANRSNKVSNLFLILRLWENLKQKRKIQLIILTIIMLLNGVAEFISFASLIPFLGVITDPDSSLKNAYLRNIFNYFGIIDFADIAIAITIIFVFTILLSASIRIINIWLIAKISASIGTDLSLSIYNKVLHQPYKFHLDTNSNELSTTITFEVNRTTEFILLGLQFISGITIMSFLVFSFISFNWYIGTPTIFTYLLLYATFMFTFKYRLTRNGGLIVGHTENQLKSVNDGLGAIRDVILDNSQKEYLKNLKSSDYPLRNLLAQKYFLGVMPRFVLEAMGIILIAFLSIFLVVNGFDNKFIITLLGGVAIISQKLLPSMQLCYNAWSNLTNTKSSVIKVLKALNLKIEKKYKTTNKKLSFKEKIVMKELNFKFNRNNRFALKDINLEIKKGEKIGIVGQTGSGKSTLVNIIMGLLEPSSGSLYVDDVSIYSSSNDSLILDWQKSLAHIPQNIYLSDQTFAENIAFGIPKAKINMLKIKKAAKIAQISQLIESYSEGYNTFVGERGIRLSGGQRQRIGLARALYKGSNILIMDEATSALDTKTEENIMNSIYNLGKDITIIMVAHRISTLSQCDKIIELKSGSIIKNSLN